MIVELKRDRTPREITAQALDYASWVTGLSNDQVTAIADDYLDADLESNFTEGFGDELPETLNGDHRILVVGSQIDPSSERIMRYLSDEHGVNINAATFQYFQPSDGPELLARVFLLEPSEVERKTRTRGSTKRRPNLSYEELKVLADETGVAELYEYAVATFQGSKVLWWHRTRRSIAFEHSFDGSRKTILNLIPGTVTPTRGCSTGFIGTVLRSSRALPVTMLRASCPKATDTGAMSRTGAPSGRASKASSPAGMRSIGSSKHSVMRLLDSFAGLTLPQPIGCLPFLSLRQSGITSPSGNKPASPDDALVGARDFSGPAPGF